MPEAEVPKKDLILLSCFAPQAIVWFLSDVLDFIPDNKRVVVVTGAADDHCPLPSGLKNNVEFLNLNCKREISLFSDFIAFFQIGLIFVKFRPGLVAGYSSKSSLFTFIWATLFLVPVRIHFFQGQRWANFRGTKRTFFKIIDKTIVWLATDLVSVSPSEAIFLESEGITKASTLTLLGPRGSISGVRRSIFSESDKLFKKRNFNRSNFCLGYVGRIHPDKGIEDLLEIFAAVDQTADDFCFLIAGPIDGYSDEILASEIQQLRSDVRVMIGSHDNTVLLELYSELDVLILPSRREGFGNVIIEAAALGVPSIAYDIPGPRTSIINGKTGFLCESVADICGVIQILKADRQLLASIAGSAAQYVKENFNPDLIAENHVKLLTKIR